MEGKEDAWCKKKIFISPYVAVLSKIFKYIFFSSGNSKQLSLCVSLCVFCKVLKVVFYKITQTRPAAIRMIRLISDSGQINLFTFSSSLVT